MIKIKKINEFMYEIPLERKEGMNVPGLIIASEKLMEGIREDEKTLEQIQNVAKLPGIIGKSIAMPDAHRGYGFPIGGVAAFDSVEGIISPGGVGYDINCGVRLLSTELSKENFLKKREQVLSEINKKVPSGLGKGGTIKLSDKELNEILEKGVKWAVENNYAFKEDLERIEDNGCISGADASTVSQRAKARGRSQIGTLGSGNHFLDIQYVEEIYDKKIAEVFDLKKNEIVIMIHTGSRGLGHQTASDYIQIMEKKQNIKNLPDRELAYAPLKSQEAQDYTKAMAAAANFAFVNRQIITYNVRQAFKKYFPKPNIKIVYDIAHNIAKFEKHKIDGEEKEVCVHRKGATRSFGPGRKEIPLKYRKYGCPIFIPGSMGTASYVLVGTKKAEEISFGSTAHGSGRVLSRKKAKEIISLEKLQNNLKEKNIVLNASSSKGTLEEAPEVYKDVDEVVRTSHEIGIGKKVAKLIPLAVLIGN